MAIRIDFHTHVFPNTLTKLVPGMLQDIAHGPLLQLRKHGRRWLKPYAASVHYAQPLLRILPESLRKPLDEMGGFTVLPNFLFEGTPTELQTAMEEAEIDRALTIPFPPLATTDFILAACSRNPALIPVAAIPSGTAKPGQALRKYVEKGGAKALKIHPAADGEGADSPRYRALLKSASDLGIPVIIHTGCMHSHFLYKNPTASRAQSFTPWFEAYPKTSFVLAHMNFHEPNIALDLLEEFPNLYVDTSWQPAEIIGEAVRRVGADRVLFATDWPMIGNNFSVGLKRIRECVDAGTVTEEDSRQILGENAAKLLGLPTDAD